MHVLPCGVLVDVLLCPHLLSPWQLWWTNRTLSSVMLLLSLQYSPVGCNVIHRRLHTSATSGLNYPTTGCRWVIHSSPVYIFTSLFLSLPVTRRNLSGLHWNSLVLRTWPGYVMCCSYISNGGVSHWSVDSYARDYKYSLWRCNDFSQPSVDKRRAYKSEHAVDI
jgi:hypothetical protein